MKPKFDSTRIAEAMISEAKKPAETSPIRRSHEARMNLRDALAHLENVPAVPGLRRFDESKTAAGAFQRVRRILKRQELPN